jgi:hypothetical protein
VVGFGSGGEAVAQVDLKKKFPLMTPSKSAPPLFRLNGCGLGLYGKRNLDQETGTYLTTLCFSLVFVPLLAFRAYRVGDGLGRRYVLGHEPLSAFARLWNTSLVVAILVIVGAVQYRAYTTSPSYVAQKKMEQAKALVEKGQLGEAARVYRHLAIAGADQSQNATAAQGCRRCI